VPPAIETDSSARAIAVAKRINKAEGKMYGAHWCSHCNNQKQELGKQASKLFEYIECDKAGQNSQYALCRSKNIPGFPTWELYGQYFPGEKSLEELESLLSTLEK